MAVYRSEFVTDIAKPFAVRPIAHQMAAGDADAYEFTVLVADSRAPETGLMAGSSSREPVPKCRRNSSDSCGGR